MTRGVEIDQAIINLSFASWNARARDYIYERPGHGAGIEIFLRYSQQWTADTTRLHSTCGRHYSNDPTAEGHIGTQIGRFSHIES